MGTALGVGAYSYRFSWVTGYKKTNGNVVFGGETPTNGPFNVTTTAGSLAILITNLPTTWPATAVGLRAYRTAVGGADGTEKLAFTLTSVMASYTDTTADAGLGAAYATTNTTGTTLSGNGSGLTSLTLPSATTAASGIVEISVAPPSGSPVAVTTVDPVYTNTARVDQANTFAQPQTFDGGVKVTTSGAAHSFTWQYNATTNSLDLVYI